MKSFILSCSLLLGFNQVDGHTQLSMVHSEESFEKLYKEVIDLFDNFAIHPTDWALYPLVNKMQYIYSRLHNFESTLQTKGKKQGWSWDKIHALIMKIEELQFHISYFSKNPSGFTFKPFRDSFLNILSAIQNLSMLP